MADIEIIKELRLTTGFSFEEIRKAVQEAAGDKNRALEILENWGATVTQKKAQRETGQGVVEAYIHATKKVGAIVTVWCETDFVARNPIFVQLARELAMQVAAMDPQNSQELLSQPYIKDQNISVQELIGQHVAQLGENIKVGDFNRYQI